MPLSAMRPCSYPGCSVLVRSGRCDAHKTPEIDYHDPESQRLYKTARWQQIRRIQLSKEPWCQECMRQEIYTPATDVDHVKPHRGDPRRFYGGPFQSLCHSCHSRKTAKEVLNA